MRGENGSECEATNGYDDRQGSAICSDIMADLFPLRAYKFFLHRFFIAVLSMVDLDSETFIKPAREARGPEGPAR